MTESGLLRLTVLLCAVIPLAIAFLLTPVSMRVARKIGAIDIPKDKRRMHSEPIPRFGGLAIFFGVMIGILLVRLVFINWVPAVNRTEDPFNLLIGVIIGGALIYIVGVIDDLKGMNAIVKFVAQIGCASVVFLYGVRVDSIGILGLDFAGDTPGQYILNYVVTVAWIVLITNTINLIDGLDGLASGVTIISSLAIGYAAYIHGDYAVTLPMVAIAGAALGFLPFNFYPARIFMGDSGALFLGFSLACVSIISPAKGVTMISTIVPFLVLGVPIFDFLFAIARRILKKQSIFDADKGHLHHRLIYMGMGQRRSVLMLYGISSVMGVAAILLSKKIYLEAAFLFCIALLFIILLVWEWNRNRRS